MKRALLALASGLALTALTAPTAGAHTGDLLARPIFERINPAVPGVEVEVVATANYQFLVNNPTPTELTIVATTGEPFIRIGPEGVFGNYSSPSWYDSNVPDGLLKFPDRAKAGADVAPEWRKVAREPTWGWYDHRLHPIERYLQKEVLESTEPVKLGTWRVPVRYGEQKGEIQGRFEYKPVLGTYKTILKSPENPAEGVKVQVVSSRTIPAIFLENTSPTPVTVLGKEGEPFARIGPNAEVNLHSPTWVEIEQARGDTPTVPADAKATPSWRQVQRTPRWSWIDFRAAPPQKEVSKEIALRDGPTTVKTWRVPLLIGDRRTELVGITQFVPRPAAAGRTGGGGSTTPLIVGVGLATVAVGFLVLRPKKKAASAKPAVRHRSRSTPKKRR